MLAALINRIRVQRRLAARFGKRINRAPSPVVAHVVPWLSVVAGSLLTGWLTVASTPLIPPLGYLLLLGWRQLHPGLLPVWAGLPLGLFDDLVSGQPPGSAVLLWSLSMLTLEAIEGRWPWRSFPVEWAVASGLIVTCLLAGGLIASGAGSLDWLPGMARLAAVTVLVYPPVARVVAWLDRTRLVRFRVIG